MASINTSINGIDISVTKLPDGQIVFGTENWPGASFGANNEPVAGHCGGLLSAANIAGSISNDQFRLDSSQKFIRDAQNQINDPSVDAAYKETLKTQIAQAQSNIQTISESISAWTALQSQVDSLTQQVQAADTAGAPNGEAATNAQTNAAAAQTVNNENANTAPTSGQTESPTNAGSDTATDVDQSKIAAPTTQVFDDGSTLTTDATGKVTSTDATDDRLQNSGLGGLAGAITRGVNSTVSTVKDWLTGGASRSLSYTGTRSGASVNWAGSKDLRAAITVPTNYLIGPCEKLKSLGGILFPYTPNISYDNQANYSTQNPMHSNWPINFYQRSTVSAINISGKFTNQNEEDGAIYLATIHLLRALTKMLWGTDANAGSPPPVCRLNAYGDSMLSNVPISIASFKVELPEGVDYITVGTIPAYQKLFGVTMVPTISTINITCNVMFSRQEMQDYSVTDWLNGSLKGKGYL